MLKKILMVFICMVIMSVSVQAESYCVMGGEDHAVFEEKDMHKTQSVASISKIMSALVAIEQGNLEDTWAVSDSVLQAEGSSIYLQVGQTVSLKSLLYGLMLRSGNDAAIEIATHISGDCESFVKLMNEKAKELGMINTIFVNPSGLDEADGGNISSAYDMALLMSEAMKNPTFAEITKSQYYTNEGNLRWKNKNKLLFDYAQTTGGKTGYTKKAGRTLVSSASKEDVHSIVVTLNSSNDFEFHKSEHELVFSKISEYVLMKAGTYRIQDYEVTIENDLCLSLHKDGSDTIEVESFLKDGKYNIEVTRNGILETYRYEAQKKGGWNV